MPLNHAAPATPSPSRRHALATFGATAVLGACAAVAPGPADPVLRVEASPAPGGQAPFRHIATSVGRLAVQDLPPLPGAAATGRQTLVLWPSILADHGIYRAQIPVWRQRHRVIVIDGPGHGASGPAPAGFSMADCADAMVGILDALGVDGPVIPVGTSWGGLVGGEFALAYPRRTRALVMLNTPVFVAPQGPSLSDRFVVWGARWLHGTTLYSDGVARAFFLPSTRARGGAQLDAFHRHLRDADGAALALATRSVLLDRAPLAPRLAGIEVPTLFVAGEHDGMYPLGALRQAAASLPHGRFVALPTAHISAVDAPEGVTRLVAAFIDTLS
ncbi:alpha/beta fold hydrolase [Rubrivivax albus]|uniref:Alpha/beta fold hydrolase n=1 Tax=Rubrivivax albus TaxID=2499835 RepID=A0A437JRA3_9BURK|nr:alpha/beta fold hydrolase [Rubrivivax albus]RVT49399.1 alpha/beta fold hydrolase [Rubrivivax albus]